ncbi:hypothetical protein [uncultured Thiothrix sp.]|jgi:ABC-type microcin C transport system permease subunit YejE|uniref:hypothetical protein n=1 Tax=uncultured Thiothrix sp. TaxID=223185 RepID=UPI00262118EB|nr:hypothetical protein [uncultured Thiothrix sp.]HMT94431.1 hypothetical protein [Thiolinea sp.]
MSIRKIKANTAEIEGDYVKVETHSQRLISFLKTFLILAVVCILISQFFPNFDIIFGLVITFSISALAAAFAPGQILRDIPLVDLVEIKRYRGKDKVTVVLDDERVKRNQSNKKLSQ